MDGSWEDEREREREKDKNEKKNSIWNPDRLCLGRSTGDPVLCLGNYSLLYVYYCILSILYRVNILIVLHILLCTSILCPSSVQSTDAVLLFIPVHFDTNNTIREPLYRTVWYLSTAPLPLAGSTPFSANGKPPKNDSAQEPTPSHGTGKPHRHGVLVCTMYTKYFVRRSTP